MMKHEHLLWKYLTTQPARIVPKLWPIKLALLKPCRVIIWLIDFAKCSGVGILNCIDFILMPSTSMTKIALSLLSDNNSGAYINQPGVMPWKKTIGECSVQEPRYQYLTNGNNSKIGKNDKNCSDVNNTYFIPFISRYWNPLKRNRRREDNKSASPAMT